MDFYNLIDMQIRLGRTCCIDNGDHIGIPEAMKIRKAMLVLLQELFSMYTEEAMGTEKEKALEDFKNFFKDLAQLCLEEKRAMLSDPHLNPCSSDFLISNLSFISLNWDILFVWCMFIAHKELNDRNSDHYVIHGKNVKLKIFNDFATFMAARKPGYDTEDNLNIKRWYPYNESVATRINDPEHLHDRIITLIRTYLPHGSTNWLECPECGKLSMYLGNAWELHSPSIAMEKGDETTPMIAAFEKYQADATLENMLALRTVIRIDFYIIISKVASPCGCTGLAHLHISNGCHSVFREDLCSFLFTVSCRNSIFNDLDFSCFALKVEIHFFWVELDSGVAEGAEDSSPVCVVAVDGCFCQGRGYYGFT